MRFQVLWNGQLLAFHGVWARHGNGWHSGIDTPTLAFGVFRSAEEEVSITKCWDVAYLVKGIILLSCNNYKLAFRLNAFVQFAHK